MGVACEREREKKEKKEKEVWVSPWGEGERKSYH
jgi:hypothetical protein